MAMANDAKWAVSLPPRLHRPVVLSPLRQLVNFTDHSGELARALGDSGDPGRTYPGASAISQLGRGAAAGHGEDSDGRSRPDGVERFYAEVCKHAGPDEALSLSRMLGIVGATPSLVMQVFVRYRGTAGFPCALPDLRGLKPMLGVDGEALQVTSLLRSVINFFMQLYVDLKPDTRSWLADRIHARLSNYKDESACPRSLRTWYSTRRILFSNDPAATLAEDFKLSSEALFGRYAAGINLPEHSSLFSSARLESLCQSLRDLPHQPLDSHQKLLDDLTREKDERIDQQWTVGAKCLEILVKRSLAEIDGMPPEPWCDLIVDLGCHPDPQLSGQAFQRYWHWANSKHLDAGRMAFVRRDLEVVFEYLKQAAQQGQIGGHMVAPRVTFYKKLLRHRLIQDTRLFLGTNAHWTLRTRLKKDQFWDLHDAGDPDLCILALKLADGVNLTTGTKSFPMRFYPSNSKEFRELWDKFSAARQYPILGRHHFMHDSPICIRKTHQGAWEQAVVYDVLPHPFLGRVDWSHYDL